MKMGSFMASIWNPTSDSLISGKVLVYKSNYSPPNNSLFNPLPLEMQG